MLAEVEQKTADGPAVAAWLGTLRPPPLEARPTAGRQRAGKPALRRVGNAPLRGLYDLRHTYATFALRAGVPVFAVSRFMGSSVAMIDYHYTVARDSREHAVSLLDALALERAVDAGWTPPPKVASPVSATVSGIFRGDRGALWTLGDVKTPTRRLRGG